jgi:hypothetical protein
MVKALLSRQVSFSGGQRLSLACCEEHSGSGDCPWHIPQRLTVEEMEPYFARLRDQITRLDAENRSLRAALGDPSDLQPSEGGAEPVPEADG